MAADYRKFKTPFYEIQIGDVSGQKMVVLPHHILRLVSKIEINETFNLGEFSSFTIDFIEGSREPASPDASLGTSGLYQINSSSTGKVDKTIAGSLTNRSGIITDLRFSGDNGITWLTKEEQKTGKIDNRPQITVDGSVETRTHIKENSRPEFLFQERNQIKITWGYVEDKQRIRSTRGYITTLKINYPENGVTLTSITCTSTRSMLDQIATVKGRPFGTRQTVGNNNSIVTYKDYETTALLNKIADDAGMAKIISKDLLASTVDSDKQKMWIGGESFDQFMVRLAAQHDCYYDVRPDPEHGRDILLFIKKTDYESKLIVTDTDLTTYKGRGSILKSVEINAVFSLPSGNSQSGVTKDGKEHKVTTDSGPVSMFLNSEGKLEKLIPNAPVGNGNESSTAKRLAEKVANGGVTGTVDSNPSTSRQRLDGIAQANAQDSTRNIMLEFTCLGYPQFHPGVMDFRNLGVRYSGKYRVLTVTHTIDSSGYTCKGTATTMSLNGGGVALPEAIKNKARPNKTDTRIFESATGDASEPTNVIPAEEYDRKFGTGK